MQVTVPLRAAAWCLIPLSAAGNQPSDVVRVVGQTPLGVDVDIDTMAANVQDADATQIRQQNPRDLAEFIYRNLGSVYVNEAQSNPLQPDLQYRGFVGSPLLGLPQGLAVYQDGVRLNEPFGDTISWALLPRSAVADIQLMPGSNPLFGLNALGGALSIRTKDGFAYPGTVASVVSGSFGRLGLDVTTGGRSDDFAWFAAGELLEDDG
jgi:outer membrane receptor protein involved in Fe transport